MKVVLLASGRSKRLKPIEDKSFINFLGKPLLYHQLEKLTEAGFDDFVLVGGAHNLDKLRNFAADLPYKTEIIEQKILDDGQAGAVIAAEEVVQDEPMLIVGGNDTVDIGAYKLVIDASKNEDFDGFIVGKEMDSYFPGGYLSTDSNGIITGIIEKPGEGNEPSNLVNIVIHYYRKGSDIFDALNEAKSDRDDKYEVAVDALIKKGLRFKVLKYGGFWQPIKYPWHVFDVMNYFLGQIKENSWEDMVSAGKVEVADSAVIKGNVYLDEGVKVLDQAVVSGPAYIGKGSVVASGALVRGSMVGANCVVGYATEVARSFLGDNVWTHSNYIGDSILGNNVSFGAGSVTGNLRFDECNIPVNIKGEKVDSGRNKFGLITGNHVRCGVNTSFMPGVKIGDNVCIGAGIIIGQDISNNKFVTGKTELKQYDNRIDVAGINREEMQKKLK